jgi:hypothetical protein
MVVEEEKAINKERKKKEQDYDHFNGSLYSVFPLDSFI